MHLAGEMLSHIATAQPELAVTDEEIFLVKTAGLCHDLGHGPFSHVFDHQFMPTAKPGTSWHHELASTMMLDHLIDDNHIEIEPDAQRFLHQLINPTDNSQFVSVLIIFLSISKLLSDCFAGTLQSGSEFASILV
jgi:HD superfamily phosphohydrolase